MRRVLSVLLLLGVFAGCTRDIPSDQPKPVIRAWVGQAGPSMLPTYPLSSLAEVELGVPYDSLKAGDIVVFWDYTNATPRFILHRLVVKQSGSWITQGDNQVTNRVADRPWCTRDNYIARATGRHVQLLVAPEQ